MPLFFNQLNRQQLSDFASTHLVVLPVAATEQHGPHLPTGTDTFACETVVRRAAESLGDDVPVIVAPTLPYGSSHHHLQFGGTMSVSSETYYALLKDIVVSLITCGFKRAMIVNGHGGNHELVQIVMRDLSLQYQEAALAAASYWQMSGEAIAATGAGNRGRVPGHAGHFETSVVMAIYPDLVDDDLPERDHDPSLIYSSDLSARLRIERKSDWQVFDGFTDSPATATRELGAEYLEASAGAVAETIAEFDRATA